MRSQLSPTTVGRKSLGSAEAGGAVVDPNNSRCIYRRPPLDRDVPLPGLPGACFRKKETAAGRCCDTPRSKATAAPACDKFWQTRPLPRFDFFLPAPPDEAAVSGDSLHSSKLDKTWRCRPIS